MHLVHLSPSVVPYWPPSPEAVVTAELTAAQRAEGHQVTVVAPAPVSDPEQLQPHGSLARRLSPVVVDADSGSEVEILEGAVEGTSVRLLLVLSPESLGDGPSFDQAARALVRQLSERPAVVHLHGDTGVDVDGLREELDGPAVVLSVYDAAMGDALRTAAAEADAVVVPHGDMQPAGVAGEETGSSGAVPVGRSRVVRHGIDVARWDPQLDAALAETYGPDGLQGKAACREALQHQAGFAPRRDLPVLAVWSGAGDDSGLDLVGELVDEILALDVQLVLLGDGLGEEHPLLRAAARGRPVWEAPDGSDTTVRQVLGGADGLILPDRSAVLGRRALRGLRYGLVPVARATGVHPEILVEYEAQSATGGAFLWGEPEAAELVAALRRFCRTFPDRDAFATMARANASVACGWDRTVALMGEIYRKALAK